MALDQNIKNQLSTYLTKIINPIEIVYFENDSDKSVEMVDLLTEVDAMSAMITIKKGDDSSYRSPSFQVNQPDYKTGIVFAGVPMGHEFTSFILAILQTGGYPLKIEKELIEQIKSINGSYKFETYISLSCHNCPDVVQALNVMSLLNPNITHTMIDGDVYQDEVKDKKIMSVPTIFLNDEEFYQGRMELEEIVGKIDSRSDAIESEKLNKKEDFDVLIVGGGPAGASSAVYAARKGIKTGIVAERFGGQVMDTLGIENFISVKATEGPKLVKALEEHVLDYEVDVMNHQRAQKIHIPKNKEDKFELELANGAKLKSKTLILSTGARWRELGVPGEIEFKGKGVAYCPHCDGPLFKGKHVAVIGGGNSGVEAAIDLAGIVGHVTLFEFMPNLKADQVLQDRLYSLKNVDVMLNTQTKEILGDTKVTTIKYMDRDTQEEKNLALEGVFIQIGLIPNTDWLKEDIKLTQYGEIEVNDHGETSVPGIFAAGDVTTVPYKQIIIAMGEGSKAALGAFDYLIRN
ncbi:alkyl hydroperoxide reductase subunit F [Methylophilaceae bacterium]|nr:alkyl hydroperoxide reductase subunit F [Methylophilaceae bacterium]